MKGPPPEFPASVYRKNPPLLSLRCSYCKQARSLPIKGSMPHCLDASNRCQSTAMGNLNHLLRPQLSKPSMACLSFFVVLSLFRLGSLGKRRACQWHIHDVVDSRRGLFLSSPKGMMGSEEFLTCLSVCLSEGLLTPAVVLYFRPASTKGKRKMIRTENPSPACVIPKTSYRRFLVLAARII